MRFPFIDALRGIAIIAVLFRHVPYDIAHRGGRFAVLGVLEDSGWAGVEIFFVLSGFLVSGLLFSEYQRTGRLKVGTFLARRGFKIYPPFYALLLVTLLKEWRTAQLDWPPLVRDALFVQNYRLGEWAHTWSLAVEEHFYLLLAGLFAVLARRGGPDPFRALWKYFVACCGVLTALRIYTLVCAPAGVNEGEWNLMFHFPTHLRIDSLFFGVLISYAWHFHRAALGAIVRPRLRAVGVVATLLLLPALWVRLQTPYWPVIGYVGLYVGTGLWIVRLLFTPGAAGPRWVGFIGRHSYSIYLWHAAVAAWAPYLTRALHVGSGDFAHLAIYFGGSLVFGVAGSFVVEKPFLWLRERLVPARGRDARAESARRAA